MTISSQTLSDSWFFSMTLDPPAAGTRFTALQRKENQLSDNEISWLTLVDKGSCIMSANSRKRIANFFLWNGISLSFTLFSSNFLNWLQFTYLQDISRCQSPNAVSNFKAQNELKLRKNSTHSSISSLFLFNCNFIFIQIVIHSVYSTS